MEQRSNQPVSASGVTPGHGSPGSGLTGMAVGDFVLRREIGRGGMGTVYEAWQQSLQRVVAVKVLSHQVSASPAAVARFQREARAAAKLHHPHIVPIFALGEQDGVYYYAMELVEGPGLNAVIAEQRARFAADTAAVTPDAAETVPLTRSGPVAESGATDTDVTQPLPPTGSGVNLTSRVTSPAEHAGMVARQLVGIADAMEYAHRHGVIHRDIKPHNLLFAQDGTLRVSDFGLARLTEQPGVTVTGEVVGSPLYMSPEQIRGDVGAIDHRTDIYSLGATKYEWLTYRPPYPGDTREQVISRILTEEPPALRTINPSIPVTLETICMKAIERDVHRRYQSAAELRDDLKRFLDDRPIQARRHGPLVRTRKFLARHQLGTLAAAALAVAALLGWQIIAKQQALRTQEAVAVKAQEESRRLRGLMEMLPLEIAGPLKLAEAAGPIVEGVVAGRAESTGSADVPAADPAAVRTPVGIARRAVRDFYDHTATPPPPPAETDAPRDTVAMLAEAHRIRADDPQRAVEIAVTCTEADPDDYDAWELQAALYGQTAQYDRMLSAAEQLVRLRPRGANAFAWRGLAHLLRQNADASVEDLTRAVKLGGFSTWGMALHALALCYADRALEALSEFDGALAQDPDTVIALLGRASAKASLGNVPGAIADLTHVLELEPENTDVLVLRGDRYVELGDFNSAKQDYSRAIDLVGPTASLWARYVFTQSQLQQSGAPSDAPVEPTTGASVRTPAPENATDPPTSAAPDWLTRLLGPAEKRAPTDAARGRLHVPPRPSYFPWLR